MPCFRLASAHVTVAALDMCAQITSPRTAMRSAAKRGPPRTSSVHPLLDLEASHCFFCTCRGSLGTCGKAVKDSTRCSITCNNELGVPCSVPPFPGSPVLTWRCLRAGFVLRGEARLCSDGKLQGTKQVCSLARSPLRPALHLRCCFVVGSSALRCRRRRRTLLSLKPRSSPSRW